MRFCLHPPSTSSEASQSRSPGWLGGEPDGPKLSGVETIPVPKWCCHMRFTATLARSGWSGEVSHLARASLLPELAAPTKRGSTPNAFVGLESAEGAPGAMGSPGSVTTPPRSRRCSDGLRRSSQRMEILGRGSGRSFSAAAIAASMRRRAAANRGKRLETSSSSSFPVRTGGALLRLAPGTEIGARSSPSWRRASRRGFASFFSSLSSFSMAFFAALILFSFSMLSAWDPIATVRSCGFTQRSRS